MATRLSGAWLRRTGITFKIGGGFAILLILMAFVAFLGLRAFDEAVTSFEEVLEADVQVAIEARRLEVITQNLVASVLQYFLPLQVTAEMQEEWLQTFAFLDERVHSVDGRAILEELWGSQQQFYEISQMEFAAFMRQEELMTYGDAALDAVNRLVAYVEGVIDEAEAETRRAAALFQLRIVAAAGVALVVGVVLAVFITRSLSGPIRRVARMAGRIAQGDLTVEAVRLNQQDEVGQMAEAFNILAENLRHIVLELEESTAAMNDRSANLAASSDEAARVTEQIAQTIEQVAAGTGDQSRSIQQVVGIVDELKRAIDRIGEGAREQARVVEEGNRLIEEIMAAVQGVAEHAGQVANASGHSMEIAHTGGQTVQRTVSGMEEIHRTVFATADKVQQLGQHSAKVGEIVEVISEIAEQTNLLALNAAIEAARAGEHGKGFAVVADEVRKLAERSAESAKEIAELVVNMKAGVDEAVQAMQVGTGEVQRGMDRAREAGQALQEIVEALEETDRQVQSITREAQAIAERGQQVITAVREVARITQENTAAAEEMSAQSDDAVRAIENISAVSEETAASTEEVSAAAEQMHASIHEVAEAARELTRMAEKLREPVERFRT